MFNVCPRCGEYSEEKRIDPSGPFAICPSCGHRHRFVRLPLFVVTGASGTGKTAAALRLSSEMRDHVWLESDILWRPEFDTPEDGYRTFRNLWLRIAKNISQAGRPVVLIGAGIPEQFEACVERRYFTELHYLALVCDDAVITERLAARPAWRKSASLEFLEQMRSFNGWLRQNAARTAPAMTVLDTSEISESQTAERIAAWVTSAGRAS
jgi:predicted kinase